MDVAVDQARHQGALAAVHDLRLGRLDRLGRHFLDRVALDQHLVAAARLVPARVEQVQILEKDLRHQRSPNMRPRTLRWPPIWRYSRRGLEGCGASLSSAPQDRARARWRSGWRRRPGLRVIELDALFWGRDWQPRAARAVPPPGRARDPGRRLDRGRQLRPGPRPRVAADADTLIWLDLPLSLVMWRLVRRTVRRAATKEELWGTGNRETFAQRLPQPPVDPAVGAEDPSSQPRRDMPVECECLGQGEACRAPAEQARGRALRDEAA